MPSSGCKKSARSEEHTSELQSHDNLVCRLLLEKKNPPDSALPRCHAPDRAPGPAAHVLPLPHLPHGDQRRARPHRRGALSISLAFFLKVGPPPEINPFSLPGALPI